MGQSGNSDVESDVCSVVKAEIALDNAFGGKEGGKVLRIVFQLTGKRLLTIAERGQEEGITVGSEHHLTAGAD